MSAHHLVLGGRKSGKTAFAEQQTIGLGDRVVYLATAQAFDAEMAARIAAHRQNRDDRFVTHEEPLNIADAISKHAHNHNAILIDCLTVWLTNLMLAEADMAAERQRLIDTVNQCDVPLVFVSNEVGFGGVSDNEMMRRFGDEAGQLHQDLAAICGRVTLVVAGIPLALKAG